MEPIIRPPSEAYSYLVLAMSGCSHNACTFCPTYKNRTFGLRDIEVVKKEFDAGYRGQKRVFLADGDAMCIPTDRLIELIRHIRNHDVERVSSYATPRSILRKSATELKGLRGSGLDMVYMGVESGSEAVLESVKKGVSRAEIIHAGRKVKSCGIKLSVTIILGLGGRENTVQHALDTATILNEIQPDYIGALTLMVVKGCELYYNNDFKQLNDFEYLKELLMIIENLDVKSVFRSNHASNYLSVGGDLPDDKEKMIAVLRKFIDGSDINKLKKEYDRGL